MGIIAVAALALPAAPATAASSPSHHRGDPRHKIAAGTSTNWSGYAVDGTGAGDVVGSWTQPRVTCAPGENSWSSPWVGIDGDNSNTVEQIGTDSDCYHGTSHYYARYEMYPKSLVQIASMPVKPGDSFTARVTYTGNGNYVLSLTNNTEAPSQPFQTTQNSTSAARSSVEWVMEGPSNGSLTNFGSVSFTGAQAAFGTAPLSNLGSFGNAADPITMVTKRGIARAVPTSPLASPDGFTVTWQHS